MRKNTNTNSTNISLESPAVNIFNTSFLGVILLMRGQSDGIGIHTLLNGAAAYSSLTYHVFTRVVFHCVPCGFRLPECPPIGLL